MYKYIHVKYRPIKSQYIYAYYTYKCFSHNIPQPYSITIKTCFTDFSISNVAEHPENLREHPENLNPATLYNHIPLLLD